MRQGGRLATFVLAYAESGRRPPQPLPLEPPLLEPPPLGLEPDGWSMAITRTIRSNDLRNNGLINAQPQPSPSPGSPSLHRRASPPLVPCGSKQENQQELRQRRHDAMVAGLLLS